MAVDKGLAKIIADCNIKRHDAYITLINHGFMTEIQGVSMHLDSKAGHNHQQSLIIHNWR